MESLQELANERYHPDPLWPPLPQDWGFATPSNPNPKLQSLLSQERVKLQTATLADTFTGSSDQKPIKNLGEKGAWAYPGTAQIF